MEYWLYAGLAAPLVWLLLRIGAAEERIKKLENRIKELEERGE